MLLLEGSHPRLDWMIAQLPYQRLLPGLGPETVLRLVCRRIFAQVFLIGWEANEDAVGLSLSESFTAAGSFTVVSDRPALFRVPASGFDRVAMLVRRG